MWVTASSRVVAASTSVAFVHRSSTVARETVSTSERFIRGAMKGMERKGNRLAL